jgi:hypothetical protein
MSKEPEQKHVLIYLTSIIHWIGAGVTLGYVHYIVKFSPLSLLAIFVGCLLLLPPIVRIVNSSELDKDEQ